MPGWIFEGIPGKSLESLERRDFRKKIYRTLNGFTREIPARNPGNNQEGTSKGIPKKSVGAFTKESLGDFRKGIAGESMNTFPKQSLKK